MSSPQDPFAPPPEEPSGSGPTPPPDQPGWGAPPPGYGAPPPGYGAVPPAYGAPPPGYGAPPPAYGGTPPPAQGGPLPPYGTPAAYPQPYGYGGYPPYPKRGTNVMAILSLVFAFVCSPVGIVMGAVALSQVKKSGEEGRGLAIAGLAVSAVFTAFVLLVFVGVAIDCSNNPETC